MIRKSEVSRALVWILSLALLFGLSSAPAFGASEGGEDGGEISAFAGAVTITPDDAPDPNNMGAFLPIMEGQSPTEINYTAKNTGTVDLNVYELYSAKGSGSAFTWATPFPYTLVVGEEISFSVRPESSLPVGRYTDTLYFKYAPDLSPLTTEISIPLSVEVTLGDADAVAKAKATVEGHTYIVRQAYFEGLMAGPPAKTEMDALDSTVRTICPFNTLNDATMTVNPGTYTPAIAGIYPEVSPGDIYGTDGSYDFTVKLTRNLSGTPATATTIPLTLDIIATPAKPPTGLDLPVEIDAFGGTMSLYGARVGKFTQEYTVDAAGKIKLANIPTPTRPGLKFAGWYFDGDPVKKGNGSVVEAAFGLRLMARWTGKNITVTYNANGGKIRVAGAMKTSAKRTGYTAFDPVTGELDSQYDYYFSYDDPVRPGYTFLGFNTLKNGKGDPVDVGSMTPGSPPVYTYGDFLITAVNHTLFAQWAPAEYEIDFMKPGGGAYTFGDTEFVERSSLPLVQADPANYKALFTGFWNAPAGATSPSYELPAVVPSSGDVFLGWTLANNTKAKIVEGTKWSKNPPATGTKVELFPKFGKTVSLKFVLDTDSGITKAKAMKSINVNIDSGTPYPKIADPKRAGYKFDGWYLDPAGWLTANEVATTLNQKTGNPNIWGAAGFALSDVLVAGDGITLYAKWSKTGSHTVTLSPNSKDATLDGAAKGASVKVQNVPRDTDLASWLGSYNDPTRPKYDFVGWSRTKKLPIINSAATPAQRFVTKNLTVNAIWADTAKTIVFNGNGVMVNGGKTFRTGISTTAPVEYGQPYGHAMAQITTALTRPGFEFAGWNTKKNGKGVWIDQYSAMDFLGKSQTLYAQWKNAAPKTLVFNTNGVEQAATFPKEMTATNGKAYGDVEREPGVYGLPVPSAPADATSLRFQGWNTAKTPTAKSMWITDSTIVDIKAAKQTLYAIWTTASAAAPTLINGQTALLTAGNAKVGKAYSLQLYTDGSQPVTWSAPVAPAPGAPPAWLSLNPKTGVLSGAPASGDAGPVSFDVTATNAAGSYTVTVELEVEDLRYMMAVSPASVTLIRDFGYTDAKASITIRNEGTETLTGVKAVLTAGTNFTIVSPAATTLLPNAFTTIIVTPTATAKGAIGTVTTYTDNLAVTSTSAGVAPVNVPIKLVVGDPDIARVEEAIAVIGDPIVIPFKSGGYVGDAERAVAATIVAQGVIDAIPALAGVEAEVTEVSGVFTLTVTSGGYSDFVGIGVVEGADPGDALAGKAIEAAIGTTIGIPFLLGGYSDKPAEAAAATLEAQDIVDANAAWIGVGLATVTWDSTQMTFKLVVEYGTYHGDPITVTVTEAGPSDADIGGAIEAAIGTYIDIPYEDPPYANEVARAAAATVVAQAVIASGGSVWIIATAEVTWSGSDYRLVVEYGTYETATPGIPVTVEEGIDALSITTLEPLNGTTPVFAISGTGYTATVAWVSDDAVSTGWDESTDNFVTGDTYTATITFTPTAGYFFDTVALDESVMTITGVTDPALAIANFTITDTSLSFEVVFDTTTL